MKKKNNLKKKVKRQSGSEIKLLTRQKKGKLNDILQY